MIISCISLINASCGVLVHMNVLILSCLLFTKVVGYISYLSYLRRSRTRARLLRFVSGKTRKEKLTNDQKVTVNSRVQWSVSTKVEPSDFWAKV